MIRCFECKHYKERSTYSGWCHNPEFSKKARVNAVDYCDKAEKKEG